MRVCVCVCVLCLVLAVPTEMVGIVTGPGGAVRSFSALPASSRAALHKLPPQVRHTHTHTHTHMPLSLSQTTRSQCEPHTHVVGPLCALLFFASAHLPPMNHLQEFRCFVAVSRVCRCCSVSIRWYNAAPSLTTSTLTLVSSRYDTHCPA